MKKGCLLLLLYIGFVKTTNGSSSYHQYYKEINKAELFIVELNFENAFDIYYRTLNEYSKHRISDLYNASLCAVLLKQYNPAKIWMKELLKKGVRFDNIFENKIFRCMPDSCWTELRNESDSLSAIYNSSVDLEYFSICDVMRKREQNYIGFNKKTYDSLIYKHAILLHKLISEKGIPSVSMFDGQPLPIDVIRHHFALRNQFKNSAKFDIDITSPPYCNMDFNLYDIEPLLIDAVYKGDISPDFVAICMEHSELDSARQLGSFQVIVDLNSKTIEYYFQESSIDIIDKYRFYLGLESLKDAARKNYEISLYYNQDIYPFEEQIKRLKEIGYNKTALDTLKGDAYKNMVGAFFNIIIDTKKITIDRGMSKSVGLENNSIFLQTNASILKEFKLNQTSCKIAVKPFYDSNN